MFAIVPGARADKVGRENHALIALQACLALPAMVLVGPTGALEISSLVTGSDGKIEDRYAVDRFGCTSPNVSLPLERKDVPQAAKSFALSIHNRDAPTGRGFWHRPVVNMPPLTTGLADGLGESGNAELPTGPVQARNDAGRASYFGPCPPEGEGPYCYIVAIDTVKPGNLDIDQNTSGAKFGFILKDRTIDKASVACAYGR